MTIVLGGQNLTVSKLVQVSRKMARVEPPPDVVEQIKPAAACWMRIPVHKIMYGVSTGIGGFSEFAFSDELEIA